MNKRAWMLPEGVVEALPEESSKLNYLEQTALKTFKSWGYQLLRPPMFEYAETFLTDGSDGKLSEQTIQFKDQKSGRQLGFRADITPQIARIDAYYLKTDKVARYAYMGEVVRSYPIGHGSVRNPSVVGAELLGSGHWLADVEMVSLLIEYLQQLRLPEFIIELGNVDIVVALLTALGVEEYRFSLFFEALLRKDKEKLRHLCLQSSVPEKHMEDVLALTDCYGGREVLVSASKRFANYKEVAAEIYQLEKIADKLLADYPALPLTFDLSDVRGYGYHNGLIFAAYIADLWQAVARGGRYDSFANDVDNRHQQRASIGFSCELNQLSRFVSQPEKKQRIVACDLTAVTRLQQSQLQGYIASLRADGD
ncbi:MAG: ATP phosphoribosyltransferase regulatory subunit, partial [Ostreibacterium sp.]